MGNQYSINQQHNNNDIVDDKALSNLYKACFENDIELVRTLLKTSSFDTINCREVNGSTALHIAVECGHTEIIRLLLHDYDVFRHLTDRQGRTAYELARTDEIKQLFRRPTSNTNRFCGNENFSTMFSRMQNDGQEIPSGQIQGYESFLTVREHYADHVYPHYDNFISYVSDRIPVRLWRDASREKQTTMLLNLIEQYIGSSSLHYIKAKELIKQFFKNGRADPLIYLFTLETPLYEYINQCKESSEILASIIFDKLRFLCKRAFKGVCFRGLSMTTDDVKKYQWAEENYSRYLVTNTFCSSTKDIDRAKFFAEARANEQRQQILMVFNFDKICFTAIQLEKLSDQLPCISNFEDEQEVLILPRTTFSVTKVEHSSPLTIIYLEHFNLDKEVHGYITYKMDALFG